MSSPPKRQQPHTATTAVTRLVIWYGPIGHMWVDVVPLVEE